MDAISSKSNTYQTDGSQSRTGEGKCCDSLSLEMLR